jgi:hypothetical protein
MVKAPVVDNISFYSSLMVMKNKLERLFFTKFFKLLEHLQFKDRILSVVWSTIWCSMSPGPGAITPSISVDTQHKYTEFSDIQTNKKKTRHSAQWHSANDSFVMRSVIYAGCQK